MGVGMGVTAIPSAGRLVDENGERLPLPRLLDLRAAEDPNRVAYKWDDDDLTFAEFRNSSRAVGARLREFGLTKGDRIALYLGNCPEWSFVWMGAMYIGVEPVAINLAYKKQFLKHQIADSDARVVFAAPEFLVEVARVVKACPRVVAVVLVGEGDAGEVDTEGLTILSFDAFRKGDLPEPQSQVTLPDGGMILYTSGTTGLSKGVPLTHGYLARAAESQESFIGVSDSDVVHVPLPLFHISGINGLMHPLRSRALSSYMRRFSPSATIRRMAEISTTVTPMVGPVLLMLWNTSDYETDAKLRKTWRKLWCAPVPVSLADLNERWGITDVLASYGQTEVMPASVGKIPGVPEGSAGKPMPYLEVKLIDQEGREVPSGEPGELLIRDKGKYGVVESYLNHEIDRVDGWYRTGDICRLDQDDNLFWVDRAADIVRRRGENISSALVEGGLLSHLAVAEAAVHGVPNDLGDWEVKAAIVLKPDVRATAAELFEHCENELPSFAVPSFIEFMDELPKNPIGRVQKFKLRERGVTTETAERPSARKQSGTTK